MLVIVAQLSRQLPLRQSNRSYGFLSPVSSALLALAQQKQAYLKISIHLTTIILLWMVSATAAVSQPVIDEEQRLSFGTLAIAANNSVSRFTFPRTGNNLAIEGQFVLIARGVPGRYRFTGFPANTALDVSLGAATLAAGGIGIYEPLSIDNFDVAEVITNDQGEAELSLGGRLDTTGSGGNYVDAPYSGTTVLRVEYWQPDVKSYVFNSQTINLEAELSSTLTIVEEQQLNFGTLFARTSNTSQAELSVSPLGSYTISEPDGSRLVSLVKPQPGILKISGAAPNYSLTIAPQLEEVLLEHTESPGSAPHLVLNALITSPDETGFTDANGELLINLGGTLMTEITASPEIYPSGQYEGTYQVTVSY